MSCWLHTTLVMPHSASTSANLSRLKYRTSTTFPQNFSVSILTHLINPSPTDLFVVGPAFPINTPASSARYPTHLFTRPTPTFVTPSTHSKTISAALISATKSQKQIAIQSLYQEAVADLPVANKRPKQLRAAFGFFEQALLFNLGYLLLSTGAVVAGTVVLGKKAKGVWF